MIHTALRNTCDIWRDQHGLTSLKKTFEDAPILTEIECNIQPTGDAQVIAALGRSASESFSGHFPDYVDLRIGDKVVQTDREPKLTFIVEGVNANPGIGLGATHNVVAVLKRTKVPL